MAFAHKPEGGEGGSRAEVQAENGASAKALRRELPGMFEEQTQETGRGRKEGQRLWGQEGQTERALSGIAWTSASTQSAGGGSAGCGTEELPECSAVTLVLC